MVVQVIFRLQSLKMQQPPQLEGFGGVINCNTNGQIALSAASSDGTITGWTGPNGFSTSDEAPVVTEPGDYTVTAIGSNGCETTRVVTVTKDDTPPTATALGGELNCNNSQQVRLSLATNDILVGWTGPNNYIILYGDCRYSVVHCNRKYRISYTSVSALDCHGIISRISDHRTYISR